MAHAVSLPSRALSEHRGLAFWMKRTLELLAELRSNPTPDVVHDLRVAIRRCRSVAAAIEEIDPHPDWAEMREGARKLFRSMGPLRDGQVMAAWLKELQPQDDPLKSRLLQSLASSEQQALKKALHQATRFDEKRWRELGPALNARLSRVPVDSDAAKCLALERLQEAKELHRRAMRTENPAPWHALRIGVKRFRYTVESLLPTAHAEWSESLKRVQDALGNIHDLDVLAETIKSAQSEIEDAAESGWEQRIAAVREENLLTYRQLALGTTSIWQSWLNGFPREQWLAYSDARIEATRRAMDSKLRRSLSVTRLSKRIWAQIRSVEASKGSSVASQLRIMRTAARLCGIGNADSGKSKGKSARTFLLKSPLPPGWSFADWENVAWAIRFQSGAEPGRENRRFAKLSVEQQARIVLQAGILRLALALSKMGVHAGAAISAESLPSGVLFRVTGIEDSPENAARFTKAKRLLERSLGKTIVMQAEVASAKKDDLSAKAEMPSPIFIVR